jgi:tRNA pseudouridine38-40 synthase
MFTYQIKVEYLGTNFVGWQTQKNGLSVQEVLEKALSKFLNDKISVMGSGRTDAGVHAMEQSAHFKSKKKISNKNIFINSINFFLSKYPVVILGIKKRSNKFHARHSAKKRIYKYFVINRRSSLVLEKNKA